MSKLLKLVAFWLYLQAYYYFWVINLKMTEMLKQMFVVTVTNIMIDLDSFILAEILVLFESIVVRIALGPFCLLKMPFKI